MNPSTIAMITKISRIASALSVTSAVGAIIYVAVDEYKTKKYVNSTTQKIRDDLDNDPGLKIINNLFPN